MRKLSLKQIQPGAQLAVDVKIHSPHPDTLYKVRLERGTKLTENHLRRLEKAGREFVYIHDPDTDDLEKYMYDEDINAIEEEIGSEMKQIEDDIKTGNFDKIKTKKLRRTIDELVSALKSTKALMAFTSLKSHDDYTGKHSIDVCRLTLALLLSNETILQKKANEETATNKIVTGKYLMEDIGIGSLLHDIGKWEIPTTLLNKSSKLEPEEWDAMQKHPEIGNELLIKLQKKGIIRSPVRMPVISHHEKFGGGGYPSGKKGNDIHIYGRITACCDVYSALTSKRPYRMAMTPNRALQTMQTMQKENTHFDPMIFDLFLDFIHPFPVGQEVVFSDGTSGVVCELTEDKSQPRARVLYRGNRRLDKPYELKVNCPGSPAIIN